jgi:hypothetical protein
MTAEVGDGAQSTPGEHCAEAASQEAMRKQRWHRLATALASTEVASRVEDQGGALPAPQAVQGVLDDRVAPLARSAGSRASTPEMSARTPSLPRQ